MKRIFSALGWLLVLAVVPTLIGGELLLSKNGRLEGWSNADGILMLCTLLYLAVLSCVLSATGKLPGTKKRT